jgi:hypothetical protein
MHSSSRLTPSFCGNPNFPWLSIYKLYIAQYQSQSPKLMAEYASYWLDPGLSSLTQPSPSHRPFTVDATAIEHVLPSSPCPSDIPSSYTDWNRAVHKTLIFSSGASFSPSSWIGERRDLSKGPTIDDGGNWAMPRTVSRVVNFDKSSTRPFKLSGRSPAGASH